MGDAFSFNAAIGTFLLSIAAILPFAKLGARKRKAMRWLFIIAALYSYAIETIQNFRGLIHDFLWQDLPSIRSRYAIWSCFFIAYSLSLVAYNPIF